MKAYLCMPWTFNPEQSWQNAVRWTIALRKRGWDVFSPILHTHKFWEDAKKIDPSYLESEDFVRWDINLMEAMKLDRNFYVIMTETALHQEDRWKLMDHQDISHYVNDTVVWFSTGCRVECSWAVANKVPVLHLESILQNPIGSALIGRFLHVPR